MSIWVTFFFLCPKHGRQTFRVFLFRFFFGYFGEVFQTQTQRGFFGKEINRVGHCGCPAPMQQKGSNLFLQPISKDSAPISPKISRFFKSPLGQNLRGRKGNLCILKHLMGPHPKKMVPPQNWWVLTNHDALKFQHLLKNRCLVKSWQTAEVLRGC